MNSTIDWLQIPPATPSGVMRRDAEAHRQTLAESSGSRVRLEPLPIELATLQETATPSVERVSIAVFAADHGVAVENLPAFPHAATSETLRDAARGTAAIGVLARALGAKLDIINLGTAIDPRPLADVKRYDLGPGTANFTREPAMNEHQLACALHAGRHAAERARLGGAQLFLGRGIGIGDTTAARTLSCALLDIEPEQFPGHGHPNRACDTDIIRRALVLHKSHVTSALEALRRLGGFEIAALAGSYIACAQMGLPALIDGFVASCAALVATRLCPGAQTWLLFSHAAAEPGHRELLAAIGAVPLLDPEMCPGGTSDAATAISLLKMACAVHGKIMTLEDIRTEYMAEDILA